MVASKAGVSFVKQYLDGLKRNKERLRSEKAPSDQQREEANKNAGESPFGTVANSIICNLKKVANDLSQAE